MNFWESLSKVVSALQVSGAQFIDRIQQLIATSGEAKKSVAFTVAMIALSAKMAKADGVVTHDEVLAFQELFEVPVGEERNVARIFNLAQQDVAGFEVYAAKLSSLFSEDYPTKIDVLDGLFHIAKADGIVHEAELHYLEAVAKIFNIEEPCFSKLKARHVRRGKNPYDVIGVDPHTSDDEVRKAYKAAVRETHPDTMIARGVPEEFIRIANDRLAALNVAYEQIRSERKL